MNEIRQLKVIVTGASGMVGEGVLHECLQHPQVAAVLILSRKPCGITHPKLTEIIHHDFLELSPIAEQLQGYDACYFCLGVSSLGISQDAYYHLTYTLTMRVAGVLSERNKGMVFCYVSGAGTDSTEKGRSAWARVKGKTENDLMKLPFGQVYAFRPGYIKPTPGLKNTHTYYRFINWLYPVGRILSANYFCTLRELGQAMVNVTLLGYPRQIINGKDIILLAKAPGK
ncbi:NAD-dependent epimerase/dehydratase family protein [Chitinophaga qingshengii]|uniref:NAD-dependent epimerase/dehydratase family protein n=1 Tax=Chitinophaga qingshengii TaxID=1569794 RepID=A0ABR7TT73_9BACT|nr:NAD-dependent epimerase/dehydratase family protein [Chitinophaga qingshengii]MBC9933228.1 NAD-dependent epimerase/dehydratase family protein [Chitinophaga qingshengii]